MNSKHISSNFVGMNMAASNEQEYYGSQQNIPQVSVSSDESAVDRHIEDMLLSHSRYYIYCE